MWKDVALRFFQRMKMARTPELTVDPEKLKKHKRLEQIRLWLNVQADRQRFSDEDLEHLISATDGLLTRRRRKR